LVTTRVPSGPLDQNAHAPPLEIQRQFCRLWYSEIAGCSWARIAASKRSRAALILGLWRFVDQRPSDGSKLGARAGGGDDGLPHTAHYGCAGEQQRLVRPWLIVELLPRTTVLRLPETRVPMRARPRRSSK
jgi:hypothetical protein